MVAAAVDDVLELDVVAIAEVEVVPTAEDVPGTHWSRIRPHHQYTYPTLVPDIWSLTVILVI